MEVFALIGDQQVVSLLHTKVYLFSDSVLCFGKMNENPKSNICMGRQIDVVQKVYQITELRTELMVSQWNSSGTSSQDSPHCSSAAKSKSYCQDWAYNQKISLDGLFSCRCSQTSHGDLKTIKKNANQVLSSFLSLQRDLEQDTMVIPRAWIREKVVLY